MVPDSALAACQILLHNTKKEQIFLSADVPPVRSPPVWPCEGLCGLLWGGAESLCPSRRIQAGFGPLSRRLGGMPIRGTALRGTKRKARKIKSPHLPAVRTAARVRQRQLTGETVLPTFGWGKQSVWLAASGCQTPFSGRSPRPLFLPRGAN